MPSRWDHLLDLKPITLIEHLVEEIAKLVAKDLETWPVQITEWSSPEEEARFRPLMEPGAPRPDAKAYEAAFLLARLEMEREYEAIDEFARNERWRAYVAPGAGYEAMQLLTRYLTEQMLAILERTGGRMKRANLVECLRRAERRLANRSL